MDKDLPNAVQMVQMLNSVSIPSMLCSNEGTVQSINDVAAIYFGAEKHQLQGNNLNQLQGFEELIDLLKADHAPTELLECSIREVRFQVKIRPITSDTSLIVLHDITNYFEREQQQHDAMHMVAHDLKAPISVIKSYSDLVKQMGTLQPAQEQFLERIVSASEHMARMVDDLLDLTWIDTNSPLDLEETRVEFLIKSTVDNLQIAANNSDITVSVNFEDDLPKIQGDANRLRRVFSNLITNAIKFSPANSRVMVSVSYKNDREEVMVIVKDSGVGIDEEYLPYIFERFYQAPNQEASEEKRQKGSGLGLAICKAIIEKHGGRIDVESESNVGTKFIITLPVS